MPAPASAEEITGIAEAAYLHYQERRQPQDDAERELYERYAAVDEVNWWAGHDDAVAEIGQCSDYYRADEIRAEQPPDFTSWFSAARDAEVVADVEPDEKPGDPKGVHGAPVVSGPVLEHPTDPLNPRSDLVPSTGWDQEPAVEVTTGRGVSDAQSAQREPDGPESGLTGPRTVTERDRLIGEFSREYPEISGPEMQQAEINKDAAENWNGAVYPPYEGPGYTEPPADWEGWHQPHSEHEREHYWDTPEHEIPPEPEPADSEQIPEAEPF
jgi:hypothetical protein